MTSIPELWVEPEAEAGLDASRSALPLEGAGFGNKGFHQGTHLAALMVPEKHRRLESTLHLCFHITVNISQAVIFFGHGNVHLLVVPPLGFRPKYLDNNWMDAMTSGPVIHCS